MEVNGLQRTDGVVTTRIGDVSRGALSVRFVPAETSTSMEVACEWYLTRDTEAVGEAGEIVLYPAGEMVRRDGWVVIKAAPKMDAQQASIG